MFFRDLAKTAYYRALRPDLLAGYHLSLGYIFHVERIFDRRIHERLLQFCRDFRALTGARVIATLMSGANPQVQLGMQRAGVTDAEFSARLRAIAEECTAGYHGHFWFSPSECEKPESAIRANNFCRAAVASQMATDLDWFRTHAVDTHGIYAAGWWFLNEQVLRLLAENGFSVDYSFSKSIWYRNQYSHRLMNSCEIGAGQPFIKQVGGREILCIQNLIGCHTTRFPEDFDRNLRKLSRGGPKTMIGVVNSHDYDLDPANTLRCIEHLLTRYDVRFLSHDALRARAAATARVVPDEAGRSPRLEAAHGA
jgi:hypothetical protein